MKRVPLSLFLVAALGPIGACATLEPAATVPKDGELALPEGYRWPEQRTRETHHGH
jgi:hypothetical protein